MNCRKCKKSIDSLHRSALLGDLPKDIQQHLEHCVECRVYLDTVRYMVNGLHLLDEESLPDGFEERLHSRLIQETAQSRPATHSWMKGMRIAGAIAGAVVIIVGVLSVLPRTMMNDATILEDAKEATMYEMPQSEKAMPFAENRMADAEMKEEAKKDEAVEEMTLAGAAEETESTVQSDDTDIWSVIDYIQPEECLVLQITTEDIHQIEPSLINLLEQDPNTVWLLDEPSPNQYQAYLQVMNYEQLENLVLELNHTDYGWIQTDILSLNDVQRSEFRQSNQDNEPNYYIYIVVIQR